MDTLTVKIPSNLAREIVAASAAEHLSKSELVRRALETYLSQRHQQVGTGAARAGDLSVSATISGSVRLGAGPCGRSGGMLRRVRGLGVEPCAS